MVITQSLYDERIKIPVILMGFRLKYSHSGHHAAIMRTGKAFDIVIPGEQQCPLSNALPLPPNPHIHHIPNPYVQYSKIRDPISPCGFVDG
jgi:hypothetical protein